MIIVIYSRVLTTTTHMSSHTTHPTSLDKKKPRHAENASFDSLRWCQILTLNQSYFNTITICFRPLKLTFPAVSWGDSDDFEMAYNVIYVEWMAKTWH